MDQKHFEDLLERYLRGDCSEEEIRQVQLWFDQIENHSEKDPEALQRALISKRIFSGIEDRTSPKTKHFPLVRYRYWLLSGVAAMCLVAYSWSTIFTSKTGNDRVSSISSLFVQDDALTVHKNSSAINQLIVLEDSSSVLLTPGSEVSCRNHFDKTKREVRLKGNAFFEVTKNPRRPFIVYCGGTVTEVIGTSFWIKTLSNSQSIEVAVKTGKVSVSQEIDPHHAIDPETPERVLLTPNQRVVFFVKKKQAETLLVETPLLLDSLQARPDRFIYNEAPLALVLADLTEGYGIDILTSNDHLKTCSFTGDLSEMDFEQKFEIVCESIGTRYTRQGTKILLTGNGCK